MACSHPEEELQRVYEGTAEARDDRDLCGLCGLIVYREVVVVEEVEDVVWVMGLRLSA
jgi:hypothetical protein